MKNVCVNLIPDKFVPINNNNMTKLEWSESAKGTVEVPAYWYEKGFVGNIMCIVGLFIYYPVKTPYCGIEFLGVRWVSSISVGGVPLGLIFLLMHLTIKQ